MAHGLDPTCGAFGILTGLCPTHQDTGWPLEIVGHACCRIQGPLGLLAMAIGGNLGSVLPPLDPSPRPNASVRPLATSGFLTTVRPATTAATAMSDHPSA